MRTLDRFAKAAARQPGAAALEWAGGHMTYSELDRRAEQLAHLLARSGAAREHLVAILAERGPDLLTAILGVMKSGAAYLPLDPAWPPQRIAAILADSGAAILISHRWIAAGLPGGSWKVIDLDIDAPRIASMPDSPLAVDRGAGDLAYVIYTSGTTGTPKGVEITNANLDALVDWHCERFSVTAGDRASVVAGPGFDASVWEIWPYLASGACLLPAPDEVRLDAEAARGWITSNRVTITFQPTVIAESLVSMDWPREANLRYLLTGADTLTRYPRAGLPFEFVNNYGPTECTVLATSGTICPGQDPSERPSIGAAVPHARVYVLDSWQQPVAAGATGELWIGGDCVGRGYRNQPQLTAERFQRDPFDGSPNARMFRTGDRVRRLPDGEFAFLGRLDDQVKIRGNRIELAEISAALNLHPAVRSSAVALRADPSTEPTLVAYLVPSPTGAPLHAELVSHLAARLPAYMVPSLFVRVERLPLNHSGKIDRDALPAPCPANTIRDTQPVKLLNETERTISHLIRDLIGAGEVGPDDNFFFIGGHSLLAAQLVAKVRQTFGVSLTLRQLFQAPTAAQLASEVDKKLALREVPA